MKPFGQLIFFSGVCLVLVVFCVFAPDSNAQSYEVTAKVELSPPSIPPVMTSPANFQHFKAPVVAVLGTCSSDTLYVVITRNSSVVATSTCVNQLFNTEVRLVGEINNLEAHPFNNGGEGPKSMPTVVYYDPEEPTSVLSYPFLNGNTQSNQQLFVTPSLEHKLLTKPPFDSDGADQPVIDYRLRSMGAVAFAVISGAALFQMRRVRKLKNMPVDTRDEK